MAYTAIKHLIPKLTQSARSRNRKPFYDRLISLCYVEEGQADWLFKQMNEQQLAIKSAFGLL
ncbi:hypothetical protein AYY17_19345 [Morganella psychrotolerans]|uniref:Uncharacterized protein n=1 Tax=Morganella psychrotolerans TaxID=368603 RepID=A0A1B8HDB3_9GAMM|nr:hypothetical protein AYY17_19345 [Morganella psychrotolerans]